MLKVLPQNISNLIAAGEVVTRPASVVKELVENAVDAGAKSVSITVRDAGKTLIQVIDDGCGMTKDDALLSLERQATSKILDVDDIELSAGAKNMRAGIVSYNVYRSTENANYALIGNVPAVAGQTYYEYIDTPETAGTYYYQVTAVYADCESEPAMAAAGNVNYVVVGVDAVAENGGMNIYPNPTKGNVTIEATGMRHITVVSMLGQVLIDTDVDTDNYILNMSQFKAGMYTVRVVTENGVNASRITVVR